MNYPLELNFQAHAHIKDILGRGLIYDDNIAIIELIKNSKDAGASFAEIRFSDEIDLNENSTITISDDGLGMSLADIQDKWLNMAFSNKKEIKSKNGHFAGNKGVGRFSCDRLGSFLTLYTKSEVGDYIKLPINWTDFENRPQDSEISTIKLKYELMERSTFLSEIDNHKFKTGTVLKITNLRTNWPSKSLNKLISELEKFSPSLDQGFELFIYSNSIHDSSVKSKLNKKISNNILEKLSFKTTRIHSSISGDGKTIISRLFYQDGEVYNYKATNPFPNLKNISAEIHFLDTFAKRYFTTNVGKQPNEYGSIFLFYNGFRISPYGNDKNDWLGLDQRKSQGTNRYLGTRELIGRIDITDEDEVFSVITSREGLAHNKAYFELVAFDKDERAILKNGKENYGYITTIIRQLEQFVVNGIEWNSVVDRIVENEKGEVIPFDKIIQNPDRYRLKQISSDKVRDVCNKVLKSDWDFIEFNLNHDLIAAISKLASDKYEQFIRDFSEKTKSKSLLELSPIEKGAVTKIIETERAIAEVARKERDIAEQQKELVEEKLIVEKNKNIFLEKLASPEKTLDALTSHVIKQFARSIEKRTKSILSRYYSDASLVSKDELADALEGVALDMSTVKEFAGIAGHVNFDLKMAKIRENIYDFSAQYLSKVASKNKRWNFNIHIAENIKFSRTSNFKPADACIFIVNLLDNARKAGVQNFYINCDSDSIFFSDDGPKGFDLEKFTPEEYTSKGMSTTEDGFGLGLYHCRVLAEKWGGKLAIGNSPIYGGAEIRLEFRE